MSAADFLKELKALPEPDRSDVFAGLVSNGQWREDLLDLITIAERQGEPTRSLAEVFRDLKIDA